MLLLMFDCIILVVFDGCICNRFLLLLNMLVVYLLEEWLGVLVFFFFFDILLYRFYFIIYIIVIINCLKFNIFILGKYFELEFVWF